MNLTTNGPLTGYKILDLSRVLSGPASTMLLCDQGAEVIKVEPKQGDITRQMGNGQDGMTTGFFNINRGKKSLALDLKSDKGLKILEKLVKDCDVFVQNFRPGAADALGLGEKSIRELAPKIIYVSISGFGDSGPYMSKRVYDPVIQAISGITDIQADDDGRPRMIRTVVPDKVTALTSAQAITAALLGREKTGKGQHVKIAMLDAMIAFLWPEGMINHTLVENSSEKVGQIAQDLIFQTLDGYITAGAMSDDEWEGLCKALDKPEWKADDRFKDTQARFNNARSRLRMTAEILKTKNSSLWLKRLDDCGVPCAPVLTRAEMIKNSQVENNGIIKEFNHAVLGRVRQVSSAASFEKVTRAPRHAPILGEHNREILTNLGYSDDGINELYREGILGGDF